MSVLIDYSKSDGLGKNPRRERAQRALPLCAVPYLIYRTYLYRVGTAILVAGSYNCSYGAVPIKGVAPLRGTYLIGYVKVTY